MSAAAPDKKYITTAQLCARWGGCSHMTVERKLKDDKTFPRPYHFTRVRLFAVDEIEVYERAAARELKRTA